MKELPARIVEVDNRMKPSRLIVFLAFLSYACIVNAELSCYTWNMEWFPAGKDDQYSGIENERTQEAGKLLHNAFQSLQGNVDSSDQILFLQEIRDGATCSNLISCLNNNKLRLASISSYNLFGKKDKQQTAIITSLPVVASGYEEWDKEEGILIVRGFSYALLSYQDIYIACFSLHLKANTDETFEKKQTDIFKRESAAKQLLNRIKSISDAHKEKKIFCIIAGDFNTNTDDKRFISEGTIRSLYGAHFRSCFTGMKKADRITCPAKDRFPDTTFDYILFKGFSKTKTITYPTAPLSDHKIVGTRLELDYKSQ